MADIGSNYENLTAEASCSCGKFRLLEISTIIAVWVKLMRNKSHGRSFLQLREVSDARNTSNWPYQGLLGAKSMRDKSTAEASC